MMTTMTTMATTKNPDLEALKDPAAPINEDNGMLVVEESSSSSAKKVEEESSSNRRSTAAIICYHFTAFLISLVVYSLFQYYVPISSLMNGLFIPVAAIGSIVWGCYASKYSSSLTIFACFGVLYTVCFGMYTNFWHWPTL